MNNSPSGNYPPGAANDPSAPYNQPEDPELQDYDVTASFVLDKSFTVTSSSEDEEGIKHDLIEDYMTPLDLINELKTRLQGELELDPTDKSIQKLIKECEGWTCDCDICIDNI